MSRFVSARQHCAMITLLWCLGTMSSVACAADLSPQQQRDVLTEALQAYDRGIAQLTGNPNEAHRRFQEAAQRFQMVADAGVGNGTLYYNLANAHLQTGDIGRAILNYRRADRIAPGDPRVQSNLAFARTLCKTPIAPGGQQALGAALLWWHDHTPTRTRFMLFAASWIVLWFALLLRITRGTGVWVVVAVVAGSLSLALGASISADVFGWGHRPAGVVTAENVSVRKGNGAGFEPQFAQQLSPGVEFDVVEHRGDWLNVQLPDGSSGWIQASQAELVP